MKMTLEELKAKLAELKWMEEQTPEVFKRLDNEYWIISALRTLYDKCKDYNQTEEFDFSNSQLIDTAKVIKFNGYIQQFDLDRLGVDWWVFAGLWIGHEAVAVSPELMESYFNKCLNKPKVHLIEPVRDLGLRDDVEWRTIKKIGNHGLALKKSCICPEWIKSYNYWEFLDL